MAPIHLRSFIHENNFRLLFCLAPNDLAGELDCSVLCVVASSLQDLYLEIPTFFPFHSTVLIVRMRVKEKAHFLLQVHHKGYMAYVDKPKPCSQRCNPGYNRYSMTLDQKDLKVAILFIPSRIVNGFWLYN